MQQQQVLDFGSYRLELNNEQLWRGKRRIRLTPKAFLVLRSLVAQPGQLVTKDALLAAVWPDTVVSEGALSRCIQELRKALGDTAKTPQYIETVHGRGFRFIAPIRGQASSPPPSPPQERRAELPLPDKPSIAVLPFANLSTDPEQEYFSDGITEDLITDLAQLSGLFVVDRHSVFVWKGKAVKAQALSRELGVRYILEGSIRKVGDRVRINAQLIDATTGGHLWAERYDRELKDVFALQDGITQQIVTALAVHMTPGEHGRLTRRDTDNLAAYESFWRAEQDVYRFTQETNLRARQLYERAIALDPGYAAAYAGLAHTYALAYEFGWSRDSQTIARSFELAHQALALDNFQVTAYHVLALNAWEQGQHEQALAYNEQAIALAPNDAYGHLCYGEMLTYAGRPEDAIPALETAMRLNPHYPAFYLYFLGEAHTGAGRYEEAIATQKRALAREPSFWPSHIALAIDYTELDLYADARVAVEEAQKLNPHFTLEVMAGRKILYKDPADFERKFVALRQAFQG